MRMLFREVKSWCIYRGNVITTCITHSWALLIIQRHFKKKIHICSPLEGSFQNKTLNKPKSWLVSTGLGSCQNIVVCALRCNVPLSLCSTSHSPTMHPSGTNHTWTAKKKNGEPTQSGLWTGTWALNRNNLWAGILPLSEQTGNQSQTYCIRIILSVAFRFAGFPGWGAQTIFQ